MIPVKHRIPTADDSAFIYATWLNNARLSFDHQFIRDRIYFKGQKAYIDRILKDSQITVICNPEELTQIFGWACFTPKEEFTLVHYAFVKETYRGLGLMKSVLQQLPGDKIITHITPRVQKVTDKYNLVYNPYALELIGGIHG
jgi:hypothetical protein